MAYKNTGKARIGTLGRLGKQTPSVNPDSRIAISIKLKNSDTPGRIISLHNVATAATESDIRCLVGNISLLEYKRTDDAGTCEPSDIVFLLIPTLTEAKRAFLTLDGRELLGGEMRVNFVNEVRFKSEFY
ncbi:hypothetical protein CC86DRAFT_407685 [Ophiobolus disseminans]|uniref:RRM domain-containing protein n=1 Tax=Ophiobolus disseminans TaxID=1469910 RepID=A0A6A6ZXB3_9PLEO|nr:hypothetical protein CC86DRAFT_407685 [Ophiobolus disseminans]